MKQTNRSRLLKHKKKQIKKSLLLTVAGIIVVGFLLLQYGLPILVSTSLFITGGAGGEDSSKKTNEFIPPPVLDIPFTATNSAEIFVKGTGKENSTVKIYVNGELIQKTKSKKDGSFQIRNIPLEKGENEIKARIQDSKNNQSHFSDPITVVFADKKPLLSIESPKNGQSFSKDEQSTQVKGKTDPTSKVTVNEYWAIVDSLGNFSYLFYLKDGENNLKITATDEAGNQKSEEIKITYSP